MADESKTVQTQESEDFSDYVATQKGGGAEEVTSGAGAEKPAAESAEASEPSKDQGQEPEGEEKSKPKGESEDDAEDEDGKEPKEPKEKKGGGGFQRRIDKLTREKRELEERLAAAEAVKKEPDAEAKPEAKPKPKSEDFDSFDEFTEALADWKFEQREAERASKEAESKKEAEAKAAGERLAAEHLQREEKARESYEDYDDVMEEAKSVKLPDHVGLAILEDERSADLAYHFAKNRTDLDRILKLSPTAAIREIGKLSATLPDTTPKPQKKTTGAPKPVEPVTGGGRDLSIHDADLGEDIESYRRLRNRKR